MSTCGAIYNPEPTKAWYRVQTCTYPTNTLTSGADVVYSPYTRQYTTMAQANYDAQMVSKGNILQYKGNSANLTKSQKYAQLAKGFSSSRKNCYASQTETYTNPNVGNLRRVNSVKVPLETPNPNCDCSCNTFEDGGTLVCNETVNPCTGEVITKTRANQLCYPSTASDVPGPAVPLCWYPYIQTWYPRQRLTMNNSTDKWPINAKNIGIAVKPPPPLLALLAITDTYIEISWAIVICDLFPITSFNVYVNNVLRENISNDYIYVLQLTNINENDIVYITALSYLYESPPSNIITIAKTVQPPTIPPDEEHPPIEPNLDVLAYINSFMRDNTIVQINTYLVNYNVLINDPEKYTEINIDTFNDLSMKLYRLTLRNEEFGVTRKEVRTYVRTVLDNYNQIWKSIYYSYKKRIEYKNVLERSEEWKKDSEILRNRELLKKYLEQLNRNKTGILLEAEVTAPETLIFKSEVLQYYRLYGVPKEGMLDPKLLDDIIKNMKIKNMKINNQ